MLQYQPAVTENAFCGPGFGGQHGVDVGTGAWAVAAMIRTFKFGEAALVDPPPRQRRACRHRVAPKATPRQARRVTDVRRIGCKRIQCRHRLGIGVHIAPDESHNGIIGTECGEAALRLGTLRRQDTKGLPPLLSVAALLWGPFALLEKLKPFRRERPI